MAKSKLHYIPAAPGFFVLEPVYGATEDPSIERVIALPVVAWMITEDDTGKSNDFAAPVIMGPQPLEFPAVLTPTSGVIAEHPLGHVLVYQNIASWSKGVLDGDFKKPGRV